MFHWHSRESRAYTAIMAIVGLDVIWTIGWIVIGIYPFFVSCSNSIFPHILALLHLAQIMNFAGILDDFHREKMMNKQVLVFTPLIWITTSLGVFIVDVFFMIFYSILFATPTYFTAYPLCFTGIPALVLAVFGTFVDLVSIIAYVYFCSMNWNKRRHHKSRADM